MNVLLHMEYDDAKTLHTVPLILEVPVAMLISEWRVVLKAGTPWQPPLRWF